MFAVFSPFLQDTSEVRTATVLWTARKIVPEARLVLYRFDNILLRSPESAVHHDLVFEKPALSHFLIRRIMRGSPIRCSKKRTSHGGMFRNGGKFGF
jgi:hypothetical protein